MKYPTTPGIYEARQRAATNHHTMVPGQMSRYAEIAIAYRHRAREGVFPMSACFDKARKLWVAGVNAQNVWAAGKPEETFADRPVVPLAK